MQNLELLTKEQLRDLSKPSFFRWLFWVAVNWALIAITFFALSKSFNVVTAFLAIIMLGSRQHALAVYGHECAHRLIGLSRNATDIVGNLLCNYPINISLSGFRHFHLEHHLNLGHDNDDPEQVMKRNSTKSWFKSMTKFEFFMCFFKRLFFVTYKDSKAFVALTRCRSRNERIFYYVFWASVAVFAWKFQVWSYVGIWWLSNISSAAAMAKVRAMVEHPFKTETYRMQIPFWMKFVMPGNIDIHFEHHTYPSIPFYNLPKARKLIGDKTKINSLSDYLDLMRDIENQVKLKYQDRKTAA